MALDDGKILRIKLFVGGALLGAVAGYVLFGSDFTGILLGSSIGIGLGVIWWSRMNPEG
jgi:hypothetical protein